MCSEKIVFLFLNLLFYSILNEIPSIYAFRVVDVNGEDTILALPNESIKIECKTDMPMAYCGFIHPTGKRYSFSGMALNDGHCAVKIKATYNDSGEWKCHIGTKDVRVEIIQRIQVRVVGQLAAVQPNLTAVHGKEVTLTCATTKGMKPLSYCRFEPPNGNAFSIDSNVKVNKPILGRYYYPLNKSLDRGDCAVSIRKVKYEDVGSWNCGAGFDDGTEHIDVIKLEVEGLYTMSTASATGITFGAIGIAVLLGIIGFLAWKKRRFLGTIPREPEVVEIQEMGPRQRSPSRSPRAARSVPSVVVESPSEHGSSPLMG